MAESYNGQGRTDLAPELPETAVTTDGCPVSLLGDVWEARSLARAARFDFSLLPPLEDEFLFSLKSVVVWYLENKSLSHASNMFQRFREFFGAVATEGKRGSISWTDILNFKGSLPKGKLWHLSALAGAIKQWHGLGYPGVDREAVDLLNSIRLPGNPKGDAVRSMDPEKGPFSDIELEALQEAAHHGYAEGLLKLDEYALMWLFLALGARSVQLAALKIKDFSTRKHGQEVIHILNMPLGKQQEVPARSLFREKLLIPQIAELLLCQINQVKEEYAGLLDDAGELPIFPTREEGVIYLPGFAYHSTGQEIGHRVESALRALRAMSERTGRPIKVSSRRFRYTLGTRAAMEGAGELVIAELLDHADTQNVGVYVQARPEIVARIDKALAMQLAPLAQAFAGRLTDDKLAGRSRDRSSRIVDPTAESQRPVGNCGMRGCCGFAAPIGCYTCRSFQAWLDGPHEEVLERLLEEREAMQQRGADLRIASANDRVILAVAEVVRRCKELRESRRLPPWK